MRPGQVYMESPKDSSGKSERMFVDASEVAHYESKGATRVPKWRVPAPGSYSEMPYMPKEDLPTVLGIAGGLIPGAGLAGAGLRIGGAALGRMIGQGATNITEGNPLSQNVPQQGIIGAASQGIGEAAAPVVNAIGNAGIGASIAGRGKQLAKAVAGMAENRVPVGGFGGLPAGLRNVPIIGPSLVRGSDAAGSVFNEALGARNAANAAAQASGTTIPRTVAEGAIKGLIKDTSRDMGSASDVRYLKGVLNSWRTRKLDQLGVPEVQRIITRFDAQSGPVYRALNTTGSAVPTAGQQARAAYQKEVADALREAIRTAVPEHRALSNTLGKTIAASKAVNAAQTLPPWQLLAMRTAAGGPLGAGVGALVDPNHFQGAQIGGAAGALGMNSPQVMSRLGLLLSDPALLQMLRMAPQAAASDVTGAPK